jgi:hypothetical protein
MKRLASAVAICLLTTALGARAGSDSQADWQRRLGEARDAVVQAQARVASAETAYTEMRTRTYPLGEAKLAVENERSAAREDLVRAQGELDAALEQARRAGVPPGLLRAAEEPAAGPDGSQAGAPRSAASRAPSAGDDTRAAQPANIPIETPDED